MNFLHWDVQLDSNDIVQVNLDKQANVRLLDGPNFHSYQQGRRHSYFGGLAKKSPARLVAPHAGDWHVVVDLGGYSGTISASVSVMKT